jgi:hypothetical protein
MISFERKNKMSQTHSKTNRFICRMDTNTYTTLKTLFKGFNLSIRGRNENRKQFSPMVKSHYELRRSISPKYSTWVSIYVRSDDLDKVKMVRYLIDSVV